MTSKEEPFDREEASPAGRGRPGGDSESRRRFLTKGATASGLLIAGAAGATDLADAVEEPRASVTFEDQTSAGRSVVVESATIEVAGYVTIHESRLLDGVAAPSIVGVTGYLDPGEYENVVVPLTRLEGNPIAPVGEREETHDLIAVPHFEASDPANRGFDFEGSPGDPDADLADVAFTNGPKEATGLPNDGVNDVASVTFLPRVSRDEIARAKYGYAFVDLSRETRTEVEEIFDRQPFAGTLAPADVRTRDEIAREEYGRPFVDLSRETRTEIEVLYDGQFVPSE